MITLVPSKISRVNHIDVENSSVVEFIVEREPHEEEIMAIDKLKLWPVASGRTEATDIKTKDVEANGTVTVRQKTIDSMHQALFEIDQLIAVSRMLKQKECLTLELCKERRQMDDNAVLPFIESIRENTKLSAASLRRGYESASLVVQMRRNFMSDIQKLKKNGWRMKRFSTGHIAIDCSPALPATEATALNSYVASLKISSNGCEFDSIEYDRKHLILEVTVIASNTKQILASQQIRSLGPMYTSNATDDDDRVKLLNDFCANKMRDILSRQMFDSFRRDVEHAGSVRVLRPSSSSSVVSGATDTFIYDPTLEGVELRFIDDTNIELGLTEKLSLVISLKSPEKQSFKSTDNCLDAMFSHAVKIALLHAETKFRTVQFLKECLMQKEAAEQITISHNPGKIISILPAINGRIEVNKNSWLPFYDLGIINRGLKRRAFVRVDPLVEVFTKGANLQDLMYSVSSSFMQSQQQFALKAIEPMLKIYEIEVKVEDKAKSCFDILGQRLEVFADEASYMHCVVVNAYEGSKEAVFKFRLFTDATECFLGVLAVQIVRSILCEIVKQSKSFAFKMMSPSIIGLFRNEQPIGTIAAAVLDCKPCVELSVTLNAGIKLSGSPIGPLMAKVRVITDDLQDIICYCFELGDSSSSLTQANASRFLMSILNF